MNSGKFGGIVALGLIVVIFGLSAFTVSETELAIKLQLGQVVQADYECPLRVRW